MMQSVEEFANIINENHNISKEQLKYLINNILDPLKDMQNYNDCILAINLCDEIKSSNDNKMSKYFSKLNLFNEMGPIITFKFYRFQVTFYVKNNDLYLFDAFDNLGHDGKDARFLLNLGSVCVENVSIIWKYLYEIETYLDENNENFTEEFMDGYNNLNLNKKPVVITRLSLQDFKDKMEELSYDVSLDKLKDMVNNIIDPYNHQPYKETFKLCATFANCLRNIFPNYNYSYYHYSRNNYTFVVLDPLKKKKRKFYVNDKNMSSDVFGNNVLGSATLDNFVKHLLLFSNYENTYCK